MFQENFVDPGSLSVDVTSESASDRGGKGRTGRRKFTFNGARVIVGWFF